MSAILNFTEKFKSKRYAYFLVYTVCFGFMALFVFRYHLIFRKTFIDGGDGISQHYNTLLYYSGLLREAAGKLISGRLSEIPMWDLRLGLGEDILQILNYHEVGDPFALLAAICPASRMDWLYTFIFILRLYLGGLAFSAFSFFHGNGRFSTLLGSFIYVFSGYTLVAVMRHLMFGVVILTFPLILLGIDRVLKGKRPWLFIFSVFLAAISNFYLLYIQGILCVLYLIFRLIRLKGGGMKLKEACVRLLSLGLGGLLAFMLSAVVLLPVLYIMLGASRVGADNNLSILYPLSYYLKFMADFTDMEMPGAWTNLMFPGVSLAAVTAMFLKKRKYTGEKLIFIVLTSFALIPVFGFIFNGFGYVTNRWCFAYAFFMGYVTAAVFPELEELTERERRITACVLAVFFLFTVIPTGERTAQTMAGGAMLLLTALFVLTADIKRLGGTAYKLSAASLYVLWAGLITSCVWGFTAMGSQDAALDKYMDYGKARAVIEDENSDEAVEETGDEGVFRIQEIDVSSMVNSAINRKVNIPVRYFSLLSNSISGFLQEMYYNTTLDYRFTSSGGRSIMDALFSVKYYIAKEGSEDKLPFNYRNKRTAAETFDGVASAYEADVSLPLGYSYKGYIPEEKFLSLNAENRQEALLEGAVLKDSAYPEIKPEFDSYSVLKDISLHNGKADITDTGFDIYNDMTVLRLELKGLDESETYIVVKGLKYSDISLKEMYTDEEWLSLSPYERQKISSEKEEHEESVELRFGREMGDYTEKLRYFTPYHMSYTGHDNYIVNMGYNEEGIKELYLFFPKAGHYSFDRFDAVCQKTAGINDKLKNLAAEPLTDMAINNNQITGRADFSEDRIMVISIPYSTGWRAYVDGAPCEIKQADLMFLGLELPKGEHEIVLCYETPGLKAGAVITLVGAVLLVLMVIYIKFTDKRKGSM